MPIKTKQRRSVLRLCANPDGFRADDRSHADRFAGVEVRLSAGRSALGREAQILCLVAGANSIFYGDALLTTPNVAVNEDEALFAMLAPVRRAEKSLIPEHRKMSGTVAVLCRESPFAGGVPLQRFFRGLVSAHGAQLRLRLDPLSVAFEVFLRARAKIKKIFDRLRRLRFKPKFANRPQWNRLNGNSPWA